MQQYLWINRWNDKRKDSAIQNQKSGSSFLSSYQMKDFRRVLHELMVGLNTTKGSEASGYVCIIPPSGNEVVKIRLSDHLSTIEEWAPKEITGLPNRRYSIVIFSNKSMPNESKQHLKELDWKSYKSQNIPVYEKTFNRYYLKETLPKLISILEAIYQGNTPEGKTLPINITENKERSENRKMNKKQTIRLNEAQFNRLVKETVKRVLKETFQDFDQAAYNYDKALDSKDEEEFNCRMKDRNDVLKLKGEVAQTLHPQRTNKFDKTKASLNAFKYCHFPETDMEQDYEGGKMYGLNESVVNKFIKQTVKRVLKESRHNDDRYWYFSERDLNREVYVPLVFNKEFVRQFDDMSNEQLYNAVLGLYDYIEGDDMPDINNRNKMCEWIWEYADDMLRNY